MKLIIVGVGNVGETLVKNLESEGHDVTVVDVNYNVVNEKVNTFDVQGYVGGCLQKEVLLGAGVEDTDFFIACTPQDEVNILSCVLAKKLGAKYTIARVRQPEYFLDLESLRENLGLDLAFNPDRRAAFDILQILKFPSAKKVELFANGNANMILLNIDKDSPIVNKTLMEIGKEYGNVLFGMVVRGEEVIIPRGNFTVKENDEVYIIGAEDELVAFSKKIKKFKHSAKSVFIVGGGNIGLYLAKELLDIGVSVKIMEKSQSRASQLADLLPNATVLNGDGSDNVAMQEEGVSNCDALVTLTGVDEENVIISLYAKQQKIKKVITKIDRYSVLDMAKNLGLDSVVSPRISIANHILRFVRANSVGGEKDGIDALYKLNDKAEALEFSVDENSVLKDIPIKKLKVKKDALIGGIVRNKEFILPTGDTEMKVGDKVIVVSLLGKIKKLSEIID